MDNNLEFFKEFRILNTEGPLKWIFKEFLRGTIIVDFVKRKGEKTASLQQLGTLLSHLEIRSG